MDGEKGGEVCEVGWGFGEGFEMGGKRKVCGGNVGE